MLPKVNLWTRKAGTDEETLSLHIPACTQNVVTVAHINHLLALH